MARAARHAALSYPAGGSLRILEPMGMVSTRGTPQDRNVSASSGLVATAAWALRAMMRLAHSRTRPAFGKRYGTRRSWKVTTTLPLQALPNNKGRRFTVGRIA